jgi:hypothetical protein
MKRPSRIPDCLAEDAVRYEPVSNANSLLTGNFLRNGTGNFCTKTGNVLERTGNLVETSRHQRSADFEWRARLHQPLHRPRIAAISSAAA